MAKVKPTEDDDPLGPDSGGFLPQEFIPARGRQGKKYSKEEVENLREIVRRLAGLGMPQTTISEIVGMDEKTLRKYYAHELRVTAHELTAMVAGKLFDKCMNEDTASIIFWLKTRGGWKEDGPPAPPIDPTAPIEEKDGPLNLIEIEFVDP